MDNDEFIIEYLLISSVKWIKVETLPSTLLEKYNPLNEKNETVTIKIEDEQCGSTSYLDENILLHDTSPLRMTTNDFEKQNNSSDGKSSFQCDICHKYYNTRGSLNMHMRIHSGERPWQCQICGKDFSYKSNMKRHMLVHSQKLFHCVVCSKSFRHRNYLNIHMRVHTGEKPYRCEKCDGTFKHPSNFKKHVEKCKGRQNVQQSNNPTYGQNNDDNANGHNKHEKNEYEKEVIRCEICGKTFKLCGNLRMHLRIHSGVRPFKCDVCDKDFVYKSNLKKHLPIHNKVKAFSCTICEKKFSQKYYLKIHMKIHSGEKPFQCHLCHMTFIQKSNYTRHVKTCRNDETASKLKQSTEEVMGEFPSMAIGKEDRPEPTTNLMKADTDINNEDTQIATLEDDNSDHIYQKNNAITGNDIMKDLHQCSETPISTTHLKQSASSDDKKTSTPGIICITTNGVKSFKCEICDKTFSLRGNLRMHQKIHTGIKPFKCDMCGKDFTYKSNLKKHVQAHHIIHLDQSASSDDKNASTPGICITSDGLRAYQCEICGKTFSLRGNLRMHKHIHTGIKPYKCDECGKDFTYKSNLKKHVQAHSGVKRFQCDICFKHFREGCYLNVHMRMHTGEKPFKCLVCGMGFIHQSNFKRHEKRCQGPILLKNENNTVEEKRNLKTETISTTDDSVIDFDTERPTISTANAKDIKTEDITTTINSSTGPSFKNGNGNDAAKTSNASNPVLLYHCHICTKQFNERSHLRRHLLLQHSSKQPYKCEKCDRKFSQISSLNIHRRMHSIHKVYKCGVCGKDFNTRETYHEHKRTHNKMKSFPCDVCGKKFTQRGNLVNHSRMHSGVKPCKCPICGRDFRYKSNLTKHMVVHNAVKAFKCDVCHKAFSTACYLAVHKRIHVGEKRYTCDVCNASFIQQSNYKRHVKGCQARNASMEPSNSMFNSNQSENKKAVGLTKSSEEPSVFILTGDSSEHCLESLNGIPYQSSMHKVVPSLLTDSSLSLTDKNSSSENILFHTIPSNLYDVGAPTTPNESEILEENQLDFDLSTDPPDYQFTCRFCDEEFNKYDQFQSHVKTHENTDKPYQCKTCKKHFSLRGNLNMHMRVHMEVKPLQCELCDRRFRYKSNLNRHVKSHSDVKPFECPMCHKSFGQQSYLTSHMKVHTGEKPYTCEKCGVKIAQRSNHIRHVKNCQGIANTSASNSTSREVTSPENKLSPPDNDPQFVHNTSNDTPSMPGVQIEQQRRMFEQSRQNDQDQNSLSRLFDQDTHVVVITEDDIARKKEYDESAFDSTTGHVNFSETSDDNSSYNQYGKDLHKERSIIFPTELNQSLHSDNRTSDSNRSIVSDNDDGLVPIQITNQANILFGTDDHIERSTTAPSKLPNPKTKPFHCTQCDKLFTLKSSLKHHMKQYHHLGGPPPKPFNCDICNKDFSSKGNLTQHQRVHSTEKPFKCNVCGHEFRYNSNLGKHMQTHTSVKPFQCHVCKKEFARACYLSIHMRIHDGIKPFQCTKCHMTFVQKNNLTRHFETCKVKVEGEEEIS